MRARERSSVLKETWAGFRTHYRPFVGLFFFLWAFAGVAAPIRPFEAQFRRGDVDWSGGIEISDPIVLLTSLFSSSTGSVITCPDAADADDDGDLNISDAISLLSYLFLGGSEPAPPGPATCGLDSRPDGLAQCLDLRSNCAPAANLFRLGAVETGVGLRGVRIPVRADLAYRVSGWKLDFLLPSEIKFTFDPRNPASLIDLNGPQDAARIGISLEDGAPDERGRPRRSLRVQVSGADHLPGQDQVLFWIVGDILRDFTHAGRYPLRFDGAPKIRYVGHTGDFQVATEYEPKDGAELLIQKRYVAVERGAAELTDTEPVTIRVLATFDTPAGFDDPERYRIVGFTVHLHFDPNLLDLQPVGKADQIETAAGNRGQFFLPEGPAFDAARQSGDLKAAWIGLLGVEGAITPGIGQPLLILRFRPKTPAPRESLFAGISLVKPPSFENPTMLVPETVPNDGPVVEAFIDGGIEIER